jgi:hypothetical protein
LGLEGEVVKAARTVIGPNGTDAIKQRQIRARAMDLRAALSSVPEVQAVVVLAGASEEEIILYDGRPEFLIHCGAHPQPARLRRVIRARLSGFGPLRLTIFVGL